MMPIASLTLHVPPVSQVMTDMVMDMLRALSSPSLDIRKKTLDISMELITSRNIDEVGLFPGRLLKCKLVGCICISSALTTPFQRAASACVM